MDSNTKAELVSAVDLLIRSPNAHELYKTMLNVAPLMARHKEVVLTGEAEPLNTLARLKTSHPDTFDSIITLVESKRAGVGYDPLEQEVVSKFDKSAYQQAFMEKKRQRERRAADIENMQRSERDKLRGRARLDFMQRQSAKWKERRDAFMQKMADAAAPRKLKKDDITLALDTFWQKIDIELDDLEATMRNGKVIKIVTTSLADLEAALKHDPYAK